MGDGGGRSGVKTVIDLEDAEEVARVEPPVVMVMRFVVSSRHRSPFVVIATQKK